MGAKKVAVLGAGSWGTALAIVLADNGHDVTIWARRDSQAIEMNERKTNKQYLSDVTLPENIKVTTDVKEAVMESEAVVISVPTSGIRGTTRQLLEADVKIPLIVHATKGIEPDTLLRVSEMMEEEGINEVSDDIVVLSGPSHAEEVAQRQPTTVTVSSQVKDAAKRCQDLFMNTRFRVYTSQDMVGVELGGALKNVMALGVGLAEGLGYGDNARAAIMTRGIAEMTRLGTKLGADPLTFAGLSGLGDLIVTCTSKYSRNWRAGYRLGQGISLDQVLEEMGMVVEGVKTTQAVSQLAQRQGTEVPITTAIYDVLFNGQSPVRAGQLLMDRDPKKETEHTTDF
ncbi:NAD(P)H-dependent glycerol-3-phosphate dehydrogenase [Salicibibacter halophilus]|uniref:Glycerol-3-phosphate dehydrogenase [NAD(P)+] n=1 Tax=Salicibibacter halophilus TaxID=2502791 RepID=A0A514LDK6_9BACI|nr:NAD(P)H-dependent glycerol-3-phosphate dehydrogenase [Salicibibacter halophilus]QDI89938.1 NAD(P)H-dependent glycerol-3-phosphate dehydrogenase [Salicibibacter halophilus]